MLSSVAHARGELEARPSDAPVASVRGDLDLPDVRIAVPDGYRADRPAGVLVMLHGAGGTAEQALALVKRIASDTNVIVVAPKSATATWDVLRDSFGPDVARIDGALAVVFAGYAVDPARIAIGGFSDGASYALTLGLTNGDLFRTILAFSPGYESARTRRGRPRIFISHGTIDGVLAIQRTSHRLVRDLRHARYELIFYEFAGGHVVPAEALSKAFALLRAA